MGNGAGSWMGAGPGGMPASAAAGEAAVAVAAPARPPEAKSAFADVPLPVARPAVLDVIVPTVAAQAPGAGVVVALASVGLLPADHASGPAVAPSPPPKPALASGPVPAVRDSAAPLPPPRAPVACRPRRRV